MRALWLIAIVVYPSFVLAETISAVRHSQKPNGFRVVLDWSDQIPNYELEPVNGGSILWLKTVTRVSAPFPERIEGWTGIAGYQSGFYRVTFPKADGAVSVFSLEGGDGKEPRMVIDVIRGHEAANQAPTVRKKPIASMKTDLAPSKASLIGAASIQNMERFLGDIEQRVAAGEVSPEDGYQLAQKYRQKMLTIFKRQLNAEQQPAIKGAAQ